VAGQGRHPVVGALGALLGVQADEHHEDRDEGEREPDDQRRERVDRRQRTSTAIGTSTASTSCGR
jgi:hypothetical protein